MQDCVFLSARDLLLILSLFYVFNILCLYIWIASKIFNTLWYYVPLNRKACFVAILWVARKVRVCECAEVPGCQAFAWFIIL